MSESNAVRVVRVIHSVAPRRLTAQLVMDALPDDKSGIVYATLSNLSKDDKGPLHKKRSDSGVLDYGITPGFDADAWLQARVDGRRMARQPSAPAAEPVADDAAQIIAVLRRVPKRLTSNDIEAAGNFIDRRVMLLALAQMCGDEGPLERERNGNGTAFYYGIKRGFDVEAWLAERGQELPKETATAPALTVAPTSAKAEVPGPVRAAAPKPAPVQVPVSVRTGPEPCQASTPAPAAGPAIRVIGIPKAEQTGTISAPTKLELYDLTAELAIVAAANLAVAVRDHISNVDDCPELARALNTFERAERIHCKQPDLRAEVGVSR